MEKKKRTTEQRQDLRLSVLFVAFLTVLALLLLLLPKREVSDLERRSLAKAPVLSWDSLRSGQFTSGAETFVSDHFPGRAFWVGTYSYAEALLGGRTDVMLGKDGRLFSAPAQPSARLAGNLEVLHDFAAAQTIPVKTLFVPTAGFQLPADLPLNHPTWRDGEILDQAGSVLNDVSMNIDLRDALTEEADYYRTDHHWTAAGAYAAYRAYCRAAGLTALEKEAFSVEQFPGFYGTTYAKAGLWGVLPDTIELWQTGTAFRVTVADDGREPVERDGLFFREELDGADGYAVYLGGNHSRVTVENPAAADGRLLIIKDSFAHALVPFLAEHYREVTMIDLRYWRSAAASELVAEGGYNEILFVYGVDSLAENNDLLWLR